MTVAPQEPMRDPSATPDEAPDTEPGDVPQGPQETNPDADDQPDVPLGSGRDVDTEAESGL
jgi:hypothetical protein